MNISAQQRDTITILHLEGRIDGDGALELDEALKQVLADGHARLILDMSRVSYINSAGLRTLADALAQAQQQQGDVKLVTLTPKVLRVLQIIGFDRFFDIHASLPEALAAFE